MRGAEFITAVKRKISGNGGRHVTDRRVAEYLGIGVQAMVNWRHRPDVTVRQMVGLIDRARAAAVKEAAREAIKPIVEFYQLTPTDSRDGVRREIFSIFEEDGTEHPYRAGLRAELGCHHGIYIFYDSRGHGLYAGKAKQQRLWAEINNAYNRDRSVQNIRRVDHPTRRQEFRTSDEKRRQIRLRNVPLHDLAAYVSAYQVSSNLIDELESLLIRGFANDLLNMRMENFSWSKS